MRDSGSVFEIYNSICIFIFFPCREWRDSGIFIFSHVENGEIAVQYLKYIILSVFKFFSYVENGEIAVQYLKYIILSVFLIFSYVENGEIAVQYLKYIILSVFLFFPM